MTTTALTLPAIYDLANDCLSQNGADEAAAGALAQTIMHAERDGSLSHGLFRLPAYVAALRSGKINGRARPTVTTVSPAVIKVHGDHCVAPLAHQVGLPPLKQAAKENGIALLMLTQVHHMAALWPEVEALAEDNLAGFACTTYMPAVAPAGARQALLGTNPVAFAWPRPGDTPFVFDMATAAMAMGEVQIAAGKGHDVPPGSGLDKHGAPTTNPADIIGGGVLLPFGGFKGSAISIMVELLTAGLSGEYFSFEAKENDNGDGGPPVGGQFILAASPQKIAGDDWEEHCAAFFNRLAALDGVRIPGARRHQNRRSDAPRPISNALLEKIHQLMG